VIMQCGVIPEVLLIAQNYRFAPDILPEVVKCKVTLRMDTGFASFECLTGILLYYHCSVENRSCLLSVGCPNCVFYPGVSQVVGRIPLLGLDGWLSGR